MRRLVPFIVAFLLVFSVVTPAAAADAPPVEKSAVEKQLDVLDGLFGRFLVGPMATVMFYDLVFWDNTLPAGSGVGTVIKDEEITAYNPTEGYSYRKRSHAKVQKVVPILEQPVIKKYGPVEVEVRTVNTGDKPQLAARVLPTDVKLKRLGLERPEMPDMPNGDAPDSDYIKTVKDVAPFPIMVDTRSGTVIPTEINAPSNAVTVAAGMTVWHDGALATVVERDGKKLTLRAQTGRADKALLANSENAKLPLVVAWLVFGACFFTLRMQFVNVRAFFHALLVTAGTYDNPDDPGEISHFQALSSALSATVGLGNIAGVALAITAGGPGAVFWMIVAALLGMSSKFTECSLGQMYRIERPDGSVSGGPMIYLDRGLSEMGMAPLGKFLAVTFALMCIGGSLGGGNMFQANQSYAQVATVVPIFQDYPWLYGIMLAFCVGLVIIGGIKRIGLAASIIVPAMCGIYVLAGMAILLTHAADVPAAFLKIVVEAFTPQAGFGGLIGVLAMGFQRASFSNEAGVGSASIAHSAASTSEPIREGIVALLEPFIDTCIVCLMTGLVVVVTGVYTETGVGDGVVLTSHAFATVLPWFPMVLSFAVVMFAFSTMISWSYYGEQCAVYLFGEIAVMPYKVLFLFCVFFGTVFKLGNVLDFSDLMVLSMAAPNILGAILLSGKVKQALDDYLGKLRAGEFDKP